jgi:toxin CptA
LNEELTEQRRYVTQFKRQEERMILKASRRFYSERSIFTFQLPALRLTLLWLLSLPALWYSLSAAPQVFIETGRWGDHTVLRGVHGREENAFENYRWTQAVTTITLPNIHTRYRILQIRAHGWRPEGVPNPNVRMTIADRMWGAFRTTPNLRTYAVLLPPEMAGLTLNITLNSDTYTPPADSRRLGIAIDWIALRALSSVEGLAWGQFTGQALLLGLTLALIARLMLPEPVTLMCGILASVALVGLNMTELLWVSLGLISWMVVVAALLIATWIIAPRLTRMLERIPDAGNSSRELFRPWLSNAQARIAWALLTAALLVRLLGAIHPLFDARDLHVHTRWLRTVASGSLYLYSTPAEFQNRQTFNPPAGYVLLLPLWLTLGDARLAVQAGVALLDSLIALLLLLIAREFGLTARAGLLAMALYVALPISLTMMWWGFAANAIAQVWWVLLLWLLLRLTRDPTRSHLALLTLVAVLCLTTHIGALVTLAALLGLVVLFGRRALPHREWNAMVSGLVLAVVFTVPVYFTAAAAPLADAPRSPTTLDPLASFSEGLVLWPERIELVARAFTLGFLPPILALAVAGMPLLLTSQQRHPLQRIFVISMLLVCVVFFFSYVFLQLLTRYIYFATPLICLAAGATLARLTMRAGGRWVTGSLLLFVAWSGVVLWFCGVLMRIKPSLVPLTQ